MLRLIKRMKHVIESEKGVSMMEVVLIIVIIGIASVPLTRLSMLNQTTQGKIGTATRAIFYAEEVMEQIVSDYMAEDGGRGFDWVLNNWPGSTPNPPSGLSGSVSISAVDTLNGVPYVTVNVTISGTDISDMSMETWLIKNQ